ncbi:MAG: ATP-binding protein, partial [Chloroflexi bacterium]
MFYKESQVAALKVVFVVQFFNMVKDPELPTEYELDFAYLEAELARLDLLIRREVIRWQMSGQETANAFRGLSITDTEADILSSLPFGTSWGQSANIPEEVNNQFIELSEIVRKQAQDTAEEAKKKSVHLRLISIVNTFGLDPFELDSFLICLAPCLDLRYERIYSYLQDDITRKQPSVNLILNLLCEPGIERLKMLEKFSKDAPLIRNRLLEPVPSQNQSDTSPLNQDLRVNVTLTTWLLGTYRPSGELSDSVFLFSSEPEEEDILIACSQEFRAFHENIPADFPDTHSKLAFYGPDRSGQESAARLLAARLKMPLLYVDLEKAIRNGNSPLAALRLALRDATLTASLPYLDGWDSLLNFGRSMEAEEKSGSPGREPGRLTLDPDILSTFFNYQGLVITAGEAHWQASGVERENAHLWISFPVPSYINRQALWKHFLEKMIPLSLTQSNIVESDIFALAGQFGLGGGQIRDAVSTARDRAVQEQRLVQAQDLFSAARAHSNPSLGSLARKIEARYKWQDIILPADQINILREVVATVRNRPTVLDDWGLGQKLVSSSGVPILFSGPPGTGKTMAAEILSSELNLDLYKIDLSGVISKYIGETEKNLERIFDEA